ncbi:MAG: DoxX family protein [Cytophagales bacterium]|nr:DoxX family protein [Armatimonadota bacterium]
MTENDAGNPQRLLVSRGLLAAVFVFAGVMHFVAPRAYVSVMPPYLPNPRALVAASGVCEIVGGVGVLLGQPARRWAGWGLIALLLAVFPANIEIARRGATFGETQIAPLWGWLRLPLQVPLIWWVYSATRQSKP